MPVTETKVSTAQHDAAQLRADFAAAKVLLKEDKSISQDSWYVLRSMSRTLRHLARQVRALDYPADARADAKALAAALDKAGRDAGPHHAYRLVFAGQGKGVLAQVRADMKIVRTDKRALAHDLAK